MVSIIHYYFLNLSIITNNRPELYRVSCDLSATPGPSGVGPNRQRTIEADMGPSLTCLDRHQSRPVSVSPYRLCDDLYRCRKSSTDTESRNGPVSIGLKWCRSKQVKTGPVPLSAAVGWGYRN